MVSLEDDDKKSSPIYADSTDGDFDSLGNVTSVKISTRSEAEILVYTFEARSTFRRSLPLAKWAQSSVKWLSTFR